MKNAFEIPMLDAWGKAQAATAHPNVSEYNAHAVSDSLAHRPPQTGKCQVYAVTFDFAAKAHLIVSFQEALTFAEGGGFAWIDLLASDLTEARELLSSIGFLDSEVIDDMLTREPSTQHGRYDHYLHGAISACLVSDGGFELERVD